MSYLPFILLACAVGVLAGVVALMWQPEPLGECIPGADPPIVLARCADVQP